MKLCPLPLASQPSAAATVAVPGRSGIRKPRLHSPPATRPSQRSKPLASPKRSSSTNELTKPPVLKPRGLSRPASVCVPFGTRKPLLSRTPCSNGSRPVRMFTCDGSVTTLWACAASKRTPSRARRSIHGVRAARVAVGAERVGAQRVDRDEQHREPGVARQRLGASPPAESPSAAAATTASRRRLIPPGRRLASARWRRSPCP